MASKPNPGKAGIFKPWDGTLTGPRPGEPTNMPPRNQTWSSVQKKQTGRMFTADEVRRIVAEAISAIEEGRDAPNFEVEGLPPEATGEEIRIGGK